MERKMKAAVLHGINDLRVEDVPVPVLGERDVLVKVSACGVCGSDIPLSSLAVRQIAVSCIKKWQLSR